MNHTLNLTLPSHDPTGVQEHDKVGLISNNRVEWVTIACAAYSLNANVVPMYEAQLPSDWTYILNDSGAKVVFCATTDIYDVVRSQVRINVPTLQANVCLDAPDGEPFAYSTLMHHATADVDGQFVKLPTPDDLANLIYTSGTTGTSMQTHTRLRPCDHTVPPITVFLTFPALFGDTHTGKPKGVELTHENFCSNVKAGCRSLGDVRKLIKDDDVSLAFLPWAHSYGQTAELWSSMAHGSSMGISRGVSHILEDLQLVQPTVLFAVPTLFKKIYDGVHNAMEAAPPLRKKLMKAALSLGRERVAVSEGTRDALGFIERTKLGVLDKLVLGKIRARFGGELRHAFVAGAACPPEVLSFMDDVGIQVCEGYGLTETSPIITINTPEYRKVGSVGKAIGGVTVHIVDEEGKELPIGEEGEICCTGPNIMRGYYGNAEATAEVITTAPDGKTRMFHTGDLGRMGEDGFLKVTGRLKELYKLENGKYVCPTPIEEGIGMSRFIAQVVLTGANQPFNVALVVPEWPAIRAELGLDDSVSDDELAMNEKVRALVDADIKIKCKNMKKFEVPQNWAFVAPFTAANDMLTPKMSIRRHKVISTYNDIITAMYDSESIEKEEVQRKAA